MESGEVELLLMAYHVELGGVCREKMSCRPTRKYVKVQTFCLRLFLFGFGCLLPLSAGLLTMRLLSQPDLSFLLGQETMDILQ